MKLLIIGGSRFLGRHLVSTALARNHQITLFNRGKHSAEQEPPWLPEETAPHLKGFMFVNSDKAISDDLTFRSLGETVRDTLMWHRAHQADAKLKAGIDRDRERAICSRDSTPDMKLSPDSTVCVASVDLCASVVRFWVKCDFNHRDIEIHRGRTETVTM